jgi:hypothetical protein
VLADVVLVLEPLPVLEVVLELPEVALVPVVPVEAVLAPEVVPPEVVPPDVAVPDVEVAVVVLDVVVPDVVVPGVVAAVVPVRSTEPVAVPVDAETLVDVVDELSLELPPMEPQAVRAIVQARDTAPNANTRAPAKLNRMNNIHPKQSSWLLNSL